MKHRFIKGLILWLALIQPLMAFVGKDAEIYYPTDECELLYSIYLANQSSPIPVYIDLSSNPNPFLFTDYCENFWDNFDALPGGCATALGVSQTGAQICYANQTSSTTTAVNALPEIFGSMTIANGSIMRSVASTDFFRIMSMVSN